MIGPVHLKKGLYIVTTTAQFFDFKPTAGTPDVDYGVLRLFVNGTGVAPSWSPVVPDDGNNAAQATGQLVLPVPDAGVTLTARAVLRGGDGGQAGAAMVITKVHPAG